MSINAISKVIDFRVLLSLFDHNNEEEGGHIFQVYGPSMSGKTALLHKIILGLIEKHSKLEGKEKELLMFICTTPGELFWKNAFLENISPQFSEALSQGDHISLNFISINHPNDLLNFFSYVDTAYRHKSSRIVIVVDSLGYLWQELLATKKTRHEMQWFYFTLLESFRTFSIRRCSSASGSSLILLANNCDSQRSRETYLRESYMLPSPLGFQSWSCEMDINIYVELDDSVKESQKSTLNRNQRLVILKGDTAVTLEISTKDAM